ncbi:MAG: amidohydrolase family protein [Lentisphaeria bacterium]|nr:amidohydrolase family protein [Lentisphaeria bacterium]
MIIDSHVHFPFSMSLPESEWGAYLVDRAARNGINALIVSDVFIRGAADAGAYPASAALRRANAYAADQSKRNPGRLYFLAYLNPQNPDWQSELEQCIADGAVGVKLWIALKDARGSLDNTEAVLRKAAEKKLPVLIHVFARAEANSPGEIDIAEFVELSQKVPECTLIGGHSGANFRESLGMFKRASDNTFWDISGTNPDPSMALQIVREAGAEKVLYGSDGPGRSFMAQLHKVTLAPLSEREKSLILFENALKIYNLPGLFSGTLPELTPEVSPFSCSEDHFIFCGRWPFFEKEAVSAAALDEKCLQLSIAKAFTVSFDSMFRIDLLSANREFRKECAALKCLHPLAVVDPEAKNIDALLEDAAQGHNAGVWYSPALLGQSPDSPQALKMYRKCAALQLPVYLNCRLGEDRFKHRSLKLCNVEFKDLAGFFQNAPLHDYIIQGVAPGAAIPRQDCRFTIEKLSDTERGLADYLEAGGDKTRLVRGSEYPFRELEQSFRAAFI